MFYLYHHHDLTRLANLLVVLRRNHVPSPLATDQVLVPNVGLGRWLKMHIAEVDGIAANIETVLPAPFFWDIVASSLPGERPDSSAYRREHLRWHLYAHLPALAEEVPEVARYLAERPMELRRWQLAEQLAGVFDQYLIYRRTMLLAWERGAGDPAPPASWQAPLWRALTARLGRNHRARLLGELIERVESASPLSRQRWPARLYCFSLGNLPPDYLRLLYALGQHCDVHFLMHNPSDGYWGDIERQPIRLEFEADDVLPGEEAAHGRHPLLASLGYAARDFLRLIYSDEFVGIRELELGEALAYDPPAGDTLLQRLQSGVIRLDATPTAAGLGADDRSFQVHACHGVLREVQVLHDQLLDLLAADPSLQPREIIVMTPDVGAFAPAIEAVFGAADGAASIAFQLADQPRRGTHPIVQTFRALLDLPLWRWGASELVDLLAVPAVMRRYDLEEADVESLARWIGAAGIRWGLDAEHREQTGAGHWAQNSWAFGLDRLLAGVAVADPDALAAGVAPVVDLEGGGTAALGQLWLLVQRLRHWRDVLPTAAPAAGWQERLNALAADLFRVDRDDRAEQAALESVNEAVAVLRTAADCLGAEPLSWEAVREILDGELAGSGSRQPFLAGGVTFCGLVPLRSVPFRVVCLLGMNDGAFPRRDRNRAMNLILQAPRLGDSSVRDDDRLLLLQWLLAARDVFYLSYTGQDTSTGEALAPSTAVAELLDFVAGNQFDGVPREVALERLVARQPMQPFSPRYFSDFPSSGASNASAAGGASAAGAQRVFTFRGEWEPGARALFGERGVQPLLVDGSRAPAPALEQIALDELKRFFDHPARYFLREVLQLDLETAVERARDAEPLTVSGLDEYALRQRLFDIARGSGPLPEEPPALVRAQALLPPPPLDAAPYAKAAAELNALLPVWAQARPAEEYDVTAVDVALPGGVRLVGRLGDVCRSGMEPTHRLRRVEPRRLGARQLLPHWIDLLALAASAGTAGLECCGFDGDGKLHLRSGSVSAEQALAHLDALAALYLEGQQRPLCFLPGLGLDYVERLFGDKALTPDDALAKCNGKLANDFQPGWEATDPWFRRLLQPAPHCLGEQSDTSEFCRIALAVLEPMVSSLTEEDAGDWLARQTEQETRST